MEEEPDTFKSWQGSKVKNGAQTRRIFLKVHNHEASLNRTDHNNNKKRWFSDGLWGITEQNRIQVKETFLANDEAPQNRTEQNKWYFSSGLRGTTQQNKREGIFHQVCEVPQNRTEQTRRISDQVQEAPHNRAKEKQRFVIRFVRNHRSEQYVNKRDFLGLWGSPE